MEGYALDMPAHDVETDWFCKKLKARMPAYFRGCPCDVMCSDFMQAVSCSLEHYPNAYMWCYYGKYVSSGVARAIVRKEKTSDGRRAAIAAYINKDTAVVAGYVIRGPQTRDAAVREVFTGDLACLQLPSDTAHDAFWKRYYAEIGPDMYVPSFRGICRAGPRNAKGTYTFESVNNKWGFTPAQAVRLRVAPARLNLHLTQLMMLDRLCQTARVADMPLTYHEGSNEAALDDATERVYAAAQLGMSVYLHDENTSQFISIPFLRHFHTEDNLAKCRSVAGTFVELFEKVYVDETVKAICAKPVCVDVRVGECPPCNMPESAMRARLKSFAGAYYAGVPARLLYANYVGLLVGMLCGDGCADRLAKICEWCDSNEPVEWAKCDA